MILFEKWTPERITTNLWLDAEDSDTITEVDGKVSRWDDKSCNDKHAEQAVALSRPTYDSANKSLVFDGSSFLSIENKAIPSGNYPFHIFVVARTGNGNSEGIFSNGRYGHLAQLNAFVTTSGTDNVSWDYNSTAFNATMDDSISSLSMILLTQGESSRTISQNGSLVATSNTVGNKNLGTEDSVIGRANTNEFLDGEISEFIVIRGELPSDEIERIEGYLAHKWGLAGNLPGDHEYKSVEPRVNLVKKIMLGANEINSVSLGEGEVFKTLWSPDRITTNLWLDASDESTITSSSGNVSQWDDKSGNDRNATQGTLANQPTTGTKKHNGLNVISSSDVSFLTVPVFGSGTYNIFVAGVGEVEEIEGNSLSLMGGSPNSYIPLGLKNNTSTNILRVNGVNDPSGASQKINGVSPSNRDDVYGAIVNNPFVYSGLDIPVMTNSSDSLILFFEAGNSDYDFRGEIFEIIIVPTLGSGDADRIEGYLAHKWGFSSYLPSNHAYRNSAPTI